MGITRVANVTGLDCIGIHVAQAIRPNSRALAVSQGKGLTLDAAKASALMESIESYHAERITLPLKIGSFAELERSHPLVDVQQLNFTKTSIYSPHLTMLWIEGYDILRSEPVWVPYETVYTAYVYPRPTGAGCFAATSNGLASGNHLLEAISHGISEVVERDCTSLWSLSGRDARDRTRIDLETIDDAGCRELFDKFERAQIDVRAWETTSDIGIPGFIAKVHDRREIQGGFAEYSGYGCHPNRGVALMRALTEAAQGRLTFIAGSRDDMLPSFYELHAAPGSKKHGEPDEADGPRPWRNFCEVPSWDGETVADDVRWELERLAAAGIERVVVVDLSKPEFGLPVVRVVIPGLELGTAEFDRFTLGRRAKNVLARRLAHKRGMSTCYLHVDGRK